MIYQSIWILEYRYRPRKNGKWSEWAQMEPAGRPITVFSDLPTQATLIKEDHYERRAVEYVRAPVQNSRLTSM